MLRDPRFRSPSIGEIAFRAGYSDPSHFCRRFKAATKTTPTNYRMAATG
jgi:AraC-like DNA-binding protein